LKNRYFGDVHDYVKYSLLRHLGEIDGTTTAVCWMLTEDDGERGGQRTRYLLEPERWGSFEPPIFDFLRDQVLVRETRNVKAIEKSDILPNCRFYSRILTDDSAQRQRYFDRFLEFARGAGFVFFDPDNGVEIGSVRYGRKNSSKYIYWNEIGLAIRANHALLIYQHLPWQPRGPFVNRLAHRLLRFCRGSSVFSIRTGHVAFFVVPPRRGIGRFRANILDFGRTWEGMLTVSEHRRD